jgi:hypothetical protein
MLAQALVRQSAYPDDVFCPLAEQQTCRLSDIFSAPRPREREPGSGEWTPDHFADLEPAAEAAGGIPPPPQPDPPPSKLCLLGLEGEYAGKRIALPLQVGAEGRAAVEGRVAVVGRSSSCDVTLPKDDQISRRHAEIATRGGKAWVRDLGSTYGTRLNGGLIGEALVQLRPGNVLRIGSSSFRLQID